MLYYDKILKVQQAPLETKNYTQWQLAQLYVGKREFDLAGSHLDEIVLSSAHTFSEREIVLIQNKHKWLPLLAKWNTEQDGAGRAQFELAQFYQSLGLQKRSEEHTSELQSRENLVCRLLLEKKKKKQ